MPETCGLPGGNEIEWTAGTIATMVVVSVPTLGIGGAVYYLILKYS
jgi:hypothetical protein